MNSKLIQAMLRLAAANSGSTESDAALLRQYVETRNESAFAEIVRRYSRLVWAVCHQLRPTDADAEDAFQATFLVLLRSAGSIRTNALGPWLHTVAHRVACHANRSENKRKCQERLAAITEPDSPVASSTWNQLMVAVHEEVANLPEHLRVPFVMCCLEGKGTKEAAEQLGWKLGTFSGRLTRAKQVLIERVEKRGLPISVIAAGTLTLGTVPANAMAKGLNLIRLGDAIPSTILVLSKGATMISKTKLLAASVMLSAGLSASIGGWMMTADAQTPAVAKEVKQLAKQAKEGEKQPDAKRAQNPPSSVQPLSLLFTGHTGSPSRVAVMPDGKHCVSVSGNNGDRTIRIWDYATGKEVRQLTLATPYPTTETPVSVGWEPDQWISLAISRDGNHVAAGSLGGLVVIWDYATGKELKRLDARSRVAALAFSPDGKSLLAATREGHLQVWDLSIGKASASWLAHGAPIRVAGYLDGRIIVSAGYDKQIRVWDLNSQRELFRCEGHMGWIEGLAISQSGKWFLTGADDIRMWDAQTGKMIKRIAAPGSAGVTGLALSPDDSRLVSVSYDGSVRIIGTESGQLLQRFDGQVGWLWGVAFAPNGLSVISTSGGHDGNKRTVYTPADFALRKWNLTTR